MVEEELGTDPLAAEAKLDADFFVATKGVSETCGRCLSVSSSAAFLSLPSSSSFIAVSGGEAAAVLVEAKVSALARAFSAWALSTAALPGLKRENLEMSSALPTALETLSSVVLIRDMQFAGSPRSAVENLKLKDDV